MNLNNLLPTIVFSLLFLSMLLYWSQAALFGQERYKILNNFIFLFAILSLTLLLILRWVESGHFPLSNLYESLLFLSWCFLILKPLFATENKPGFSLIDFVLNLNKLSIREKSEVSHEPEPCAPMMQTKESPFGVPAKRDFLEFRKSYQSLDTNLQIASGSAVGIQNQSIDPKNPTFLELSSLGLGVVLSPLALLTFGFAYLSLPKEMQQSTALVPALQSNWLMMHVTVMILSYAALLSGSILSIAFLILIRFEGVVNKSPCKPEVYMEQAVMPPKFLVFKDLLRFALIPFQKLSFTLNSKYQKGEVGANPRFVSVQNQRVGGFATKAGTSLTARLDNYSYRILALGFPLLTIGILSGAVWANEAWGSYWSWDPKETWALITWLVFAIYLHTRITKGWSGEKPAIVASVGFFMVWFCYLGVNLLGTGLHSYGWF